MIKPNFMSMNKTELRAYIIAHPDDKAAFHTFVDRFASETGSEIFLIYLNQIMSWSNWRT